MMEVEVHSHHIHGEDDCGPGGEGLKGPTHLLCAQKFKVQVHGDKLLDDNGDCGLMNIAEGLSHPVQG